MNYLVVVLVNESLINNVVVMACPRSEIPIDFVTGKVYLRSATNVANHHWPTDTTSFELHLCHLDRHRALCRGVQNQDVHLPLVTTAIFIGTLTVSTLPWYLYPVMAKSGCVLHMPITSWYSFAQLSRRYTEGLFHSPSEEYHG